jgi:hypothetical protein
VSAPASILRPRPVGIGLAIAPAASRRRPRSAAPEDLDFIRIDFGYEPGRTTFPPYNSLRREGTDPDLDDATADKEHLKHCVVIGWLTGVESTRGRLAAAL